MNLKIGLKIGGIELEFEGPNETFEAKFESVFNDLLEFGKARLDDAPAVKPAGVGKISAAMPPMTVKAIAAKLGGDSGGELLYAAIASLAVIKQKETFTRQEILDEMRAAVGYYKPTYSGNLTGYLEAASKKGLIIETAKDLYALKDSARADMEQKLGQ